MPGRRGNEFDGEQKNKKRLREDIMKIMTPEKDIRVCNVEIILKRHGLRLEYVRGSYKQKGGNT